MNALVRNIVITVCGCLLAACILLAFTAGVSARKVMVCSGVDIVIADSLENSFVTKADVKGFLDKEYGQYIGTALDSIDLQKVEEIIDGRSAVKKSEAYVTKDGLLHVSVTQRRPVVRFHKNGGGFYADAEGFIFPLQSNYASHVQVIDGNIPLSAGSGDKGLIEDPKEMAWFRNVMNLVNTLEKSRTWKDKIVQMSVNSDGNFVLVPREGKEVFIFGQPTDVASKLEKMEKYYTHIVPQKGKDRYREVDVRFEGQIVCR